MLLVRGHQGALVASIVFAIYGADVRAGGICTIDANCDLSPNFCRPGICDLLGQCQYTHSDAMCRVPPFGDNLFCNGDDFCNETTQACAVNPVSCQPPTPQCNESLNSCVECLNSSHCTAAPRLICNTPTGSCVQCTSDQNCNDGLLCNGQETCNQGTGLCQNGTSVSCSVKRCHGGTNVGGTCTTNADCPGGGTCAVEYCSEIYQGCVQCERDDECDEDLEPEPRFCNGSETCNTQGRCAAGTPPVCKRCNGGDFAVCQVDGDCQATTCTASGFCDEGQNGCVQCLADSQCPPDLTYCTDRACVFNSCTQVHNPVGHCGDGLFCNGDELCVDNTPGSVCTNCMITRPDTCFGGSRSGLPCSFPPNCPGGSCLSYESECRGKVCNSNATTPPYKTCSSSTDCPAGVSCVEACCGAGAAVNCEDGVNCTLNRCNETTNSCATSIPTKTCNDPARTLCESNADCPVHSPVYTCTGLAYCDDGAFCNGQETCNGAGCINQTPRICFNIEQEVSCQSDADCFFCKQGTNDGNPCVGAVDCPGGSCIGTTCQVDCRSFTSQCTRGECNETTNQCVATPDPLRVNEPCNDASPCTINEVCSASGTCVPDPSLPPSDAYRCVKLEWRNVSSSSIFVGDTVTADLYAVADGCAGNVGACTTGQVDIVGLRALISWNNIQLSLDPPGSTNPQDPCNSGDACFVCPAQQYNWQLSALLNDCPSATTSGDGINGPCPSAGFPGNDGNALYTAFDQILPCPPSPTSIPVCVPTGGLYVTRFRFRALSGGQSTLGFLPCAGSVSKSLVTCSVTPPSPLTSADVLKALTPSSAITVKCTSNAQCNDQNVCTNEVCDTTVGSPTFQTCIFTSNDGAVCDDGVFCTLTDVCSNAVCTGSDIRCTGSGVCVGGSNPGAACTSHAGCTNGWCNAITVCDEANDRCAQCLSATSCNDNGICTQDVCDAGGMCQNPPVPCSDGLSCTNDSCAVTSVNPPMYECRIAANHTVCSQNNPSPFCSALICDPLANPNVNPTGCIFDHECVSANGNPCDDPATCDEQADNCGGCFAPAVIGPGGRYLTVTPNAAQGSTPVAVLVEGDCNETSVSCVSKYLAPRCVGGPNDGLSCLSDADCPKRCLSGSNAGNVCTTDANCPAGSCRGVCDKGFMGDTPTYLPASSWGSVHVHGAQIRPNDLYHVYSICNFGGPPTVSAATQVRAAQWGNTNNDDTPVAVDFSDISAVVNAFRGFYSPLETYQSVNLMGAGANACGDVQLGCVAQECINFGDVAATVDAFRGAAFPCPAICP